MAQEFALATPSTEEMTEVAVIGGGAGIIGLAEGVALDMAPQLGALQPMAEWGMLLGMPLLGVAGALFTKGMLGNLFTGVAAGSLGVLGFKLPTLLAAGIPGIEGLTRQPGSKNRIKELTAGNAAAAAAAAQRARQAVGAGIDF